MVMTNQAAAGAEKHDQNGGRQRRRGAREEPKALKKVMALKRARTPEPGTARDQESVEWGRDPPNPTPASDGR